MKIHSAIALLCLSLIPLACGGTSGTDTSATIGSKSDAAAATTTTEQEVGYPVPEAPPHKGPLKKLVVKDLKVGTGPVAHWGDEVAVRYVGLVYQNGDIYSQHWGRSLVFKMGDLYSVAWQKSIEGMRVGGRREILIPKHLLFEDEDVAYVLGLLWVDPKGAAAGTEKATASSFVQEGPFSAIKWKNGKDEPEFDPPDRRAPKKVLFRDLEVGSGHAAQPGDEVAILYTGAVYRTGKPRFGGSAGPYRLGSGGLGSAFEEGLEGMEPGGRRELIIPSRLLGGTAAIDYAIAMKSVKPAAEP
jgi:peptidylprolyl isomerase